MEDQRAEEDPKGVKGLVSFYSKHLWSRFSDLLYLDSDFCWLMSKLSPRTRCRGCLPLPLPSHPAKFSMVLENSSGFYFVLEDLVNLILLNLHNVEKNLLFWQSIAMDSDSQKLNFILFERGPRALVDGIARFFNSSIDPSQYASLYISKRVVVLRILRSSLATFLAQIYMEVERCRGLLERNPQRTLASLLAAPFNRLFLDLHESIDRIHAVPQIDYVDGSYLLLPRFKKLPEPNQEDSNLTDSEVAYAVNLANKNLQKLDSYVRHVVAKHKEPKKITRHWIRYTCGAIGLSVCSMWLLKHSSAMGSSGIDNWIREPKDSTFSFFSGHVVQLFLSIRDALLGTFRKKDKRVVEMQQVHSTADSLQRSLLTTMTVSVLSPILLMVICAGFKTDTKREERDRIGKHKRRGMLWDLENDLVEYQRLIDRGLENESHFMFGTMLYNLDRLSCLSHDAEYDAQGMDGFECLKYDISNFGKSNLHTKYKLVVTQQTTACISGYPLPKRHLVLQDRMIEPDGRFGEDS